jgi:hypothetical protein
MADNVAITAGSGTSIATDDAGAGGHCQIVKLAISADGSATVIPADATNGIDVDVTRVIPGTTATALGKAEDAAHADGDTGVLMLGVRNHGGTGADGDYSAMSVTSTGELRTMSHRNLVRVATTSGGLTTAATAYAIGDQVGTQFTMAGCARNSGGTGTIVGCVLISAADTIGAFDVVVTRASITPAANDAAFAISDADALNIVGIIQLNGAFDIGNNRVCQAFNLAIPYDCSGGTSLFCNLITRFAIPATPFAAVTDLQLVLLVELN